MNLSAFFPVPMRHKFSHPETIKIKMKHGGWRWMGKIGKGDKEVQTPN